MEKIQLLSEILGELYLKLGNTDEVVKLSQFLDILVVEEQKTINKCNRNIV